MGGRSGVFFLAICYQIEASGDVPRRQWPLEGSDAGLLTVFTPAMTASGRASVSTAMPSPASVSMTASGRCFRIKVGLDVTPKLPAGIDADVFSNALRSADRVRTNEGEARGTVFLLVPDGTPLANVGYPLDNGGMSRGFVADNVCFMKGNIDKELATLLFDCAHIVGGLNGVFLAIRYQVEPSGDPKQIQSDNEFKGEFTK